MALRSLNTVPLFPKMAPKKRPPLVLGLSNEPPQSDDTGRQTICVEYQLRRSLSPT